MYLALENKGVLDAVMHRFEHHRLPRILDIKNWVDQGGALDEMHIQFLQQVLHDTQEYKGFVDKHPEFQNLYARVAHLYGEITRRALENEKRVSLR